MRCLGHGCHPCLRLPFSGRTPFGSTPRIPSPGSAPLASTCSSCQVLAQVPHLRGPCGCSALPFKIRAGLAESPRPYILLPSCMCRVRVRQCLKPRRVSGVALCLVVPVVSQWKRHTLSSQGNGSWGGDSDLEASQRLDLRREFGRAMLVISALTTCFKRSLTCGVVSVGWGFGPGPPGMGH